MVPAQVITALDPENKPEIATKVPAAEDDKSLTCISNCEDTAFDMELLDQQPMTTGVTEGSEVDITECTQISDIRLSEADDPNATEYSSSFGDTISVTEDVSRLSDAEVNSRCCGDNGMCSTASDGFDNLFWIRKKKTTSHWRRYIRPLMWRCKWMELRIKDFQSQALKYDRELVTYDQRKQFELEQYPSEGCARSLPFSRRSQRRKAMKRRKRKKVEDMVDISSSISFHNLFSYYENKRFDVDGASADDDCSQVTAVDNNKNDEFDINSEWPSLEIKKSDSSLEKVFPKIETLQSRVQKLKSQMDKLLTVNAIKFSSTENLSLLVPSKLPMSFARGLTSSPRNGNTIPRSEVSSHGEVTPFSNIIENMMVQLSATEAYLDQHQIENLCQDIVDDVLIQNQLADKELHNFEMVSNLAIEKPPELVKEEEKNIVIPLISTPEPVPVQKTIEILEETVLKYCLGPKYQEPMKEQEKNIVTPSIPTPQPDLAQETIETLEQPVLSYCLRPKFQEPMKEQEKNIITPLISTPEPDMAQETIETQEHPVRKYCFPPNLHVPKKKRKRVERKAGSGAWNAKKISSWRSSPHE